MPPSAHPCALCHSFMPTLNKVFVVGPSASDSPPWLLPFLFPTSSLIFLFLFCLTVTHSSHHSRNPYAISIGELRDSFSSIRATVRCGHEHLEPPHASLPAPLHLLGWIHLVTHVIPDCP